jgi:hypothetical protein
MLEDSNYKVHFLTIVNFILGITFNTYLLLPELTFDDAALPSSSARRGDDLQQQKNTSFKSCLQTQRWDQALTGSHVTIIAVSA